MRTRKLKLNIKLLDTVRNKSCRQIIINCVDPGLFLDIKINMVDLVLNEASGEGESLSTKNILLLNQI